jgi:hypothetical protein
MASPFYKRGALGSERLKTFPRSPSYGIWILCPVLCPLRGVEKGESIRSGQSPRQRLATWKMQGALEPCEKCDGASSRGGVEGGFQPALQGPEAGRLRALAQVCSGIRALQPQAQERCQNLGAVRRHRGPPCRLARGRGRHGGLTRSALTLHLRGSLAVRGRGHSWFRPDWMKEDPRKTDAREGRSRRAGNWPQAPLVGRGGRL